MLLITISQGHFFLMELILRWPIISLSGSSVLVFLFALLAQAHNPHASLCV